MPRIRIEVNGVFNRRLIRKNILIDIPETAATDTLLRIIGCQLKLKDTFEGSPIILLNGRRIDSGELRLSEGDTLSLLSPLTGG
ncbi:MAG: hypothetical protein M1503_09615 [Thaumarchaeota archaeon]|nr:hypothetical protein [Nitrososphaerota archaeon]MCL5318496.1 hypothetical protein [Nitrososphaerota archaeon]